MSGVGKLEAQLELAKLCDALEEARDAMHADREDEGAMATYNDLSTQVADARSKFRTDYPTDVSEAEDADGVAVVESIDVTGEVKP